MKKKKREEKNTAHLSLVLVAIVTIGSFFLFAIRIIYISNSKIVEGTDLQRFAAQRTVRKDALVARRGSIYDVNGNVIAQNVSSYTLIAYLDENRTTNRKNPQHVTDPKTAAELLAPVLNMKEEEILHHLSKKNVYQTEFGSKAKGLSELKKDEIIALGIKGLDFIETQKRYYPYGDFLSYTIGYAKEQAHPDDPNKSILVGEMGLEKYFDKELSGTDGYTLYQKDVRGYKIPGTKEITVAAKDGNDIYLTIDINVQLFLEQSLKKSAIESRWDWTTAVLADAKTGEILAMSSDPSFDPNKRNMTTYLDRTVSLAFEPGSTMKIFSYMAAMEKNLYNADETYKSGTYTTADGTVIGDWNRDGWGHLTYKQGFALSSNTAVINLIKKGMSANDLKTYYQSLGFGSKTGIKLPNEANGKVNFRYETEVLNAGFGQGLTTTPIQNVKAITAITNNGHVLEPNIVYKIINPNSNKTIYQVEKSKGTKVASETTVKDIRDLMIDVIEGTSSTSTGYPYYIEGYKLAAKTGTAQVARENGKGYSSNVVKSIVGFFPYDDPKIILYLASQNPKDRRSGSEVSPLKTIVSDLVINISSYLNIYDGNKEEEKKLESYILPSLVNDKLEDVVKKYKKLDINTFVIGNGDKIIQQYPSKATQINKNTRIILITNDKEQKLPDFKYLSHKEAVFICNFLKINCEFQGNNYVIRQSLEPGTIITEDLTLTLELKANEKEDE